MLKARLDCFLFLGDWEDLVSRVMQFLLTRPIYDHCPILLDYVGVRRGKSSFRFENMWLTMEGFVNKIKEWWQTYNFRGRPSFVLVKKLHALKSDLKKWNKEFLGNESARKDVVLEQLNYWDSIERLRLLSEQNRRSQQASRDKYNGHFTILEETS